MDPIHKNTARSEHSGLAECKASPVWTPYEQIWSGGSFVQSQLCSFWPWGSLCPTSLENERKIKI